MPTHRAFAPAEPFLPLVALLLLPILLLACGDSAEPDPAVLTTTIDTVAGTVVVHDAGQPPEWSLEQTLDLGTLGSVGEPAPDEFGRVTSVLADADGNVYVADQQAAAIRVFSPDGRLLRSIGGSGSGPGEIGFLFGMAWLGDTLAVMNAGNARIGTFLQDGQWAGSWRWQPFAEIVRFLPGAPGEAYAHVRRGTGVAHHVFVRFTPAGPRDTLAAPERPPSMLPVECAVSATGNSGVFPIPFAPKLVSAITPAGEWAITSSADYRVAVVNPAGDTTRVIERDHEPAPVADAEWVAAN